MSKILEQRPQHLAREICHVHGLHVLELPVEAHSHARLRLAGGVVGVGVERDVREVHRRSCDCACTCAYEYVRNDVVESQGPLCFA